MRLHYEAGSLPLIIPVDAGSDTTLVMNGPNGRSTATTTAMSESTNPSIRDNQPRPGRHEIWVGSDRAGTNARAHLHISEVRSQ